MPPPVVVAIKCLLRHLLLFFCRVEAELVIEHDIGCY